MDFWRLSAAQLSDVEALVAEWEGEERLLLAKVKAKYQGALGSDPS